MNRLKRAATYARQDKCLDMWFAGADATAIARALKYSCKRTVDCVIIRARKRGDPRAVHHYTGTASRSAISSATHWRNQPQQGEAPCTQIG